MYATRITFVVTSALLFLGSTQSASAATIYVDQSAADPTPDGLTWCTAYMNLGDAITTAAPGDAVHVAAGIYKPDEGASATPGDRTATFLMKTGVAIRGGFAGCGAPDPDARDTILYDTILSGDLFGNDTPGFVNNEDNAYHVVTALDVDATAVLDGVTVTGGNADGPNFGPSPDSKDQGSALNIYYAAPTIRNCTFRANFSANHGAVNNHGSVTIESCRFQDNHAVKWAGGLFIAPGTVASVTDCDFVDNSTSGTAGGGGAVAVTGNSTFTNCRFNSNSSDANGGAVYIHGGGRSEFTGCSFDDNYAVEQGGAIYNTESDPTLTDSSFVRNTADHVWAGGAIFNDTDTGGTIIGCYFSRNRAPRGGAIWNHDGTTTRIIRCLFEENTAASGGAVANARFTHAELTDCEFYNNRAHDYGGAMYNRKDSAPIISRCRFGGNTADLFGGAIWNLDAYPVFMNSTFIGNSAPVAGAIWDHSGGITTLINCTLVANYADDIGGAIYSDLETTSITNCILWRNVDASGDGASAQISFRAGTIIDMNYTCAEGSIFGGTGNVDADPLFVDADGADNIFGTPDDDVRLRPESPCIDGGNNTAIAPGHTMDLDANHRVSGLRVDMGAYEFQFDIPALDEIKFAAMMLAVIAVGIAAFRRIGN